jgi:phosphoserine phosphatase
VIGKHPDAAFGNSRWDADMLAIARHGFSVNPNPDLEKRARESGWTIYWPVLENQVDRKEDNHKGH